MIVINWLLAVPWLAFLIYWTVSAIGVKKDTVSRKWWQRAWTRVVILVLAAIVLSQRHINIGTSLGKIGLFSPASSVALMAVGAALCWAGIALAIWARYHLGRNWSNHPDIKEGHELVTSGPYRLLRHPIYTGMLAALLGTALMVGWFWFIVFAVTAFAFVRRIRIEEGYMLGLFPDAYPAYVGRTKALVPFVW
ncbi:isoprenylcysteine carboxylmethyltransferase family protein [Patescibacteria group bacterium]|nr:isoprenylcysteine carboxylmethyltransferase family protein [Patescibacteria group bacterium]